MHQRQSHDFEGHIRDVPLLARLPKEDVRALAARGRLRRFATGDLLVREGEPGDSLHVLVEGSVRIVMTSPEGGEVTVTVLGPGDCIGEFALFDGQPRSASAVAGAPTQTFVVTRQDFSGWLADRPSAAVALLETLSLRLRKTNQGLADVMFLDVPHRLAKQLAAMSETASTNHGGEVRLKTTQAELASLLAVTRESVNKELHNFARRGWVRTSRGAVTVLNVEALRTYA
jgi:CRP-like cAMP-binding protein